MLTDFIIEQLKEKNRIIIPDFGAIMARQDAKGATTYSFSPFLKYNDGVLINYLANKDNLTKDEAQEKLNEFINSIKTSVDKNGSFLIKNVGKFCKDNKGGYTLTSEEQTLAEESPAQAEKTETPIEKTEEKPVKNQVNTEDSNKKETVQTPKPKVVNEKFTNAQKTKENKPNQNKKATTKEKDITINTIGTAKTNQGQSKLILIIAAVVIIVGALGFSIWKFDLLGLKKDKASADTEKVVEKKSQSEDKEKPITDEKEISKEDALAKENTQTKTTKQENVQNKKKTEITIPGKGKSNKYFIIAGSFKNPAYANSYADKMKSEGYNVEIITKEDGMNAVSIFSFESKTDALSKINELKQQNKQIWLLYY